MTWFNNLRISGKFLFVVLLILFLTIILSVFSIWQLSRVNGSTVEIATNCLPSVKLLGKMQAQVNYVRRGELLHIIRIPQAPESVEKRLENARNELKKTSADYEKVISSPEERKMYEDFLANWNAYLKEQNTY